MLDYSQDKFQAIKEKIQEEHLTKDDLIFYQGKSTCFDGMKKIILKKSL